MNKIVGFLLLYGRVRCTETFNSIFKLRNGTSGENDFSGNVELPCLNEALLQSKIIICSSERIVGKIPLAKVNISTMKRTVIPITWIDHNISN